MKKIALLAAVMGLSFGVQAAQPFGPITQATCPNLAEGVTISLSNNIFGAIQCTEAAATRGIYVATCSTAGRTSPRSVELSCNAQGLDPADPAYIENAPDCDAQGRGEIVNFRGSFIYEGSTRGGRILPSNENNRECTQATVNGSVDTRAGS